MPATSSDRRLIVFTGGAVVIAAVLFAGVLLLATNQGSIKKGPLFFGIEKPIIRSIRTASPRYEANPLGGDGFWFDVERGKLVALVLNRPGTQNCAVKWKAQLNTYLDCDGNAVTSRELDRYKIIIGARNGSPKHSVFVDLRKVSPAPGSVGSSG